MNKRVDFIYDGKINEEFLFFLKLDKLKMLNQFEVLLFFLLKHAVSVGE